eukprot:SAG31_NODE_10266_length_1162_cov_13.982126_1_plen_165_part_00
MVRFSHPSHPQHPTTCCTPSPCWLLRQLDIVVAHAAGILRPDTARAAVHVQREHSQPAGVPKPNRNPTETKPNRTQPGRDLRAPCVPADSIRSLLLRVQNYSCYAEEDFQAAFDKYAEDGKLSLDKVKHPCVAVMKHPHLMAWSCQAAATRGSSEPVAACTSGN